MMEKNLKNNTYIYNWITLLYTWNIVNQLHFNLQNGTVKVIECCMDYIRKWLVHSRCSMSFFPHLFLIAPRRWIYLVSVTPWNWFGICLFPGFFREAAFIYQRAISLSFGIRQVTMSCEVLALLGVGSEPHSSDEVEMDMKPLDSIYFYWAPFPG